jgi:hypothetical protein
VGTTVDSAEFSTSWHHRSGDDFDATPVVAGTAADTGTVTGTVTGTGTGTVARAVRHGR